MPHIVFTGGGTAGHVTPNIALIEELRKQNWQIDYIGSQHGVEKDMITALQIPYHAIYCGKLRRYFSWSNVLAPFLIMLGILQAWFLLKRLKPQVVFSKGGFVAFPVVCAAWCRRIPIIAHESDLCPGLANRLSFPFVNILCVTFAEAKKHFKNSHKVVVTGTPLREQFFHGQREQGLAMCGFNNDKPCLLVIGGSLGASAINACVRHTLDKLCEQFQVVHLCGRGKFNQELVGHHDYIQFEYVNEGLSDLLAAAHVVVSRAGANALYEILALAKPHVLIPLSRASSRGDQIQNAQYFAELGISTVIEESDLTSETLLAEVSHVFASRAEIVAKIKALSITSATVNIIEILKQYG